MEKLNRFYENLHISIKVAATYFTVGVMWILFSDKILNFLVSDNDLINKIQTIKGLLFIVITTMVVYFSVIKFNMKQEVTFKKLKIVENSSKAILENLPFAIFQKNLDFTYISANSHYEEYLNKAGAEIVGITDYDIFDSDDADKIRLEDKKLLSSREVITYVEERYSNGEMFYYNVIKTLLYENGEPKGIIGVIMDLTESKKQELKFKRSYLAIEKSTNGVVITNNNGIIEYVNKAYEDMSGYSREELIGESASFFKTKNHTEEFYKNLWTIIQNGETWKGEINNRRKNGDMYWERNFIMPVIDDGNEIVSFVALKEDITQEKETEAMMNELEEFREKVIDNTEIWISVSNSEWKVVLWNPAAERISGYSAIEAIGNKCVCIKSMDDNERLEDLEKNKELNSIRNTLITTKNGEEKIMSLTTKIINISHSGDRWNLCMGVDVTKQVLAERALKSINTDLEERVKLRTDELFKTNEFLEQSMAELEEQQAELTLLNDQLEDSLDELKTTQEQLITSEKLAALGELVAGVAHEINTPLGIGVTLSTYIKERHKELKEKFINNTLKKVGMKDYVESVDEAIDLMVINLYKASELVSSFKQVAVDQSTLELRKFNMKTYISEVLLSLHPRLKKTNHSIHVECEDDIEIIGYPGALSQIITNLVMNTLIHGFENKEKGQIHIQVSKHYDEITFKYRDDGVGIPPEEHEEVFKPFYTTKKNRGSTGLGMHIIHNIIVQILHGRMEFRSEVDEGVEMLIRFPALNFEDIKK